MKLNKKLIILLLISYLLTLPLVIATSLIILISNQDSNLSIFKKELVETNVASIEESSRLFFASIQSEFLKGRSKEEILKYIVSIDKIKSALVFDYDGDLILEGHSKDLEAFVEKISTTDILKKKIDIFKKHDSKDFIHSNKEQFLKAEKPIKLVSGYFRIYDPLKWIIGYGKISDLSKSSIVYIKDKNKAARRDFIYVSVPIFVFGMIIIFAIVIYFLRRFVSKPLKMMSEGFSEMAQGDLNRRVEIHSQDEFGGIAHDFNDMADQLAELFSTLELRVEVSTSKLQNTLAHLNAIMDNMPDGLIVTNLKGTITRVNPAITKMFDRSREELLEKDCQEVLDSKIHELVNKIKESPKEGFTAEIDLFDDHTGKAVASAIVRDKLQDSDDNFLGTVILIRDITTEKEVDRMKTDFISMVSHELRTPLTSVVGYAKLIDKKLKNTIFPQTETNDPKIKKAVEQVKENTSVIVSEGDRLTSLINDVLDIAKMEAGRMTWESESVPIEEVVDSAIAATQPLFLPNKIGIVKEIEDNLPNIIGDKDKLQQVLVNLLSNSSKFTEKGSVTCKAKQKGDHLIVSIIDTGSGISKEDQEKVFDKFKQVGDTLTDKPKGTGLGLPICRQIVEHHGGEIWIESILGKGSNFSFSLAIQSKDSDISRKMIIDDIEAIVNHIKDHVVPARKSDQTGKKMILVVDDDTHIRNLLKQELESEDYSVKEAENGLEAISQVKTERPDLIILDIKMPIMNGFDAAAVLKNNPFTMDIPVIILSIVEDKERGFRLGVDRYFTKPIDTEKLIKEINILTSQGVSPKKVLVVDEQESTVKTIAEVLKAKGHQVVEAYDGKDCIEKAKSSRPDMIIIDALFSKEHNIVKTIRFEKGLENVLFFLLGEENKENVNKPKETNL